MEVRDPSALARALAGILGPRASERGWADAVSKWADERGVFVSTDHLKRLLRGWRRSNAVDSPDAAVGFVLLLTGFQRSNTPSGMTAEAAATIAERALIAWVGTEASQGYLRDLRDTIHKVFTLRMDGEALLIQKVSVLWPGSQAREEDESDEYRKQTRGWRSPRQS